MGGRQSKTHVRSRQTVGTKVKLGSRAAYSTRYSSAELRSSVFVANAAQSCWVAATSSQAVPRLTGRGVVVAVGASDAATDANADATSRTGQG